MKPVIVGIDPGTTSAVACVDFNGDLVKVHSGTEMPKSEIIEEIIAAGIPIIVASDKASTPSTVGTISSNLGAKLYAPDRDLSQKTKNNLGRGNNSHEVDASAAALHAYKQNAKSIRKLKRKNRKQEDKNLADLALEKFSASFVEVQETSEQDKSINDTNTKQQRIQSLKSENGQMQKKIEMLKAELRSTAEKQLQAKARNTDIMRLESMLHRSLRKNRNLEKKLGSVRQKASEHRSALHEAAKGKQVVVSEDSASSENCCIAESRSRAKELRSRGVNARTESELEGEWYGNFFIAEEIPDLELDEMT